MNRPQSYEGDKPFIFVSYSHKDNYAVWPIIDHMVNDGFRVWYDNGINPGLSWDEVIANKILECDYFIAVISENYKASDVCKDELNFARERVKNLLLIYLEDTVLPSGLEMRIGRIQAIKAYEFDTADAFYSILYRSNNISEFCDRPVIIPGEVISEISLEEGLKEEPSKAEPVVKETYKEEIPKPDIEEVKPKHVDSNKSIIPGFRSGKKFHKVVATIIYIFSLLFIIVVAADVYTSVGTKYAAFDVPRGIFLIIGYILMFIYTSNFGYILNRMFKFNKRPMWLQILIIILGDALIAALMFVLLVATEVFLLTH